MGPRTERELLPPESARAIYLTIEAQGDALRAEIAHGSKSANERLDHILRSLDDAKNQMADGRVKFEHHDGKLNLLDTKIDHVNGRVDDVKQQVDDVESDFGKFYPVLAKKQSPTGLHPTVQTARTLPPPSTALEKKQSLLFSINPKLINAFLMAAAAVIGTAAGGWLVSRLTDMKIAQMMNDNAKLGTPTHVTPTPTPTP